MIKYKRCSFAAAGCLFIGLILLIWLSLSVGRYHLGLAEIFSTVFSGKFFGSGIVSADIPAVIVLIVRLPRILTAVLCGTGLAMSGAAMQGIFRNPLVGPEIVGVSAGASFGGALGIMLSFNQSGIVGAAFVFGLAALASASALARAAGRSGILALILAGMVAAAFFSALTGLVQYTADPIVKLPSITYWLLGSFVSSGYSKVAVISGVLIAAGIPLMLLRWRINIISLGDGDASALGIRPALLRWIIVVLVALIVAAQVSVSGGIGWVGIIVPHMARMLVGPDHRKLIPVSGLIGGIFLLAVDDVARTAGTHEIPIGLLTSVIGAPVFACLLLRSNRRGWSSE